MKSPPFSLSLHIIDRKLAQNSEAALTRREKALLGFLSGKRRQQWLAARWAVKEAAAYWWPGLAKEAIDTCCELSAAPWAIAGGGRRLWVSVSHDGRLVLAAASKHGPLGIDLQSPDPRCVRLAERFYPPAAKSLRSAAAWWASLEAAVKCVGESLTKLLRTARPEKKAGMTELVWPGGKVRLFHFSLAGRQAALAWRSAWTAGGKTAAHGRREPHRKDGNIQARQMVVPLAAPW